MKKYIIGIIIGLILACGVAYATEILIPASSISYTSEYTNKTNVADAIDELLNGGAGCPEGYICEPACVSLSSETPGDIVYYGNLKWKVVSSDEEGTVLILAENYETGAFDENSSSTFEGSTAFNLLNDTMIEEPTQKYFKIVVKSDCLKSQGKYNNKDYYVRLPEKTELSENISNDSETPFWTQTASSDKVYFGNKEGTDGVEYIVNSATYYYHIGTSLSTITKQMNTVLSTSLEPIVPSSPTANTKYTSTVTNEYYGSSYTYSTSAGSVTHCSISSGTTTGPGQAGYYRSGGTCQKLTIYSLEPESLGLRPVIKVKRVVEE